VTGQPLCELPPDALVILVGPSGAGKSTWAAKRFGPHEVLESDAFRAMVADDARDQAATADAFKLLHSVARARARRGLRSVIDATNLTAAARRALTRIAAGASQPVVAVVFDVPLQRCLANNEARSHRRVPPDVIARHQEQLKATRSALPSEGYAGICWLGEGDIEFV